jgi:hypothetical protein
MTALQSFFDHAAERAASIFREQGELTPMWHAVDRDDEHLVIATPWRDADEKQAVVELVRKLFRERGVKRYVFMCEAWAVVAPDLDEITPHIGNLNKHPDRREILTVHAEDRDGTTLMGWYYILRPEHAPATVSPLHMVETTTQHTGTLHGLLRQA